MKMLATAAAISMALTGIPIVGTTVASAHDQGPYCSFYSIDRDGDQHRDSRPCHHLPRGYDSPRPGFQLYFDFGQGEYYFDDDRGRGHGGYRPGRNQDLVCLVTFFKRSQVEAGADRNVQRAEVMPRRQAERIDRPNDRRAIFDYGTNKQTRDTCRYLDRLN